MGRNCVRVGKNRVGAKRTLERSFLLEKKQKKKKTAWAKKKKKLPSAERRGARAMDEHREAENAAKRRRYNAINRFKGADSKFNKKFLDAEFGFTCSVCDRLWLQDDLMCISNVTNRHKKQSALDVLSRSFPGEDVVNFKVCGSCKDSLLEGKVPLLSKTRGYVYPPIPAHLPPLNIVEERLVAPRIPFMSIRRLSHGGGQFGIKGQVVNVPIDVQKTVQSLPRSIDDDVAINVHLKRRLLAKPIYAAGTVHVHVKFKRRRNG